jgi:phosphocarrier protein
VAAQIVKVATEYESEIWITKDGARVDARSVLDILTLMCPQGAKVQVVAQGKDATDALDALSLLFQRKFGES